MPSIELLFSEGLIEKYFVVSSLSGDGIDELKQHLYDDNISSSM